MDLRLDVTERDGVAVLAVGGEVDLATAPRLRQQLVETASSGQDTVVVDLTEVEFLDSTGLGVLISGLKRFRTLGGNLVVACGQPRIVKVFEVTGLLTALGVKASVDEAIAVGEVMSGIDLEVPARPEYVSLVRLVVSSLASAVRDLDDERLDNLKLAVSEACTLVVEAEDVPGRRLVLRFEQEDDAFVVEVHDGRSGIVPAGSEEAAGLPDPNELDEDDTVPFQLMRALVDEVDVIREAGRETLRLRLVCPPAP